MSKNKKSFYITTTLPYVNADPHIGFALEIIQADVVARYHKLYGYDVLFNFGTDEHGLKIYRKAVEAKKDPQKYVDEYAAKYDKLKNALNLSYNSFIRTTDKHHVKAAREFWKICDKNGYVYKKNYKSKYCVGCELEKTDSELENGRCVIHPTLKLEIIEEENYFFKFSEFEKRLLELYKQQTDFVVPDFRLKEIKEFVGAGLKDFSISRLKKKLPWGVEVPGDPDHVMYVWFDALVNYISAVGWPTNKQKFNKWWPVVQVAGKDNLRQQTAIWQAMLLAAGLAPSKQILIHGFLTKDGEKISKSLGNTVDPIELSEKYGVDALRYYLLAKAHPFKDGDFTYKKFERAYNSDLADGIGNFVNRVIGLLDRYYKGKIPKTTKAPDNHELRLDSKIHNWKKSYKDLDKYTPAFRADLALSSIWKFISEADKYVERQKPWEIEKAGNKEQLAWVVYGLTDATHQLAWLILPFLPETARKIAKAFKIKGILKENPDYKDSWTNIKPGTVVKLEKPLFPRLK